MDLSKVYFFWSFSRIYVTKRQAEQYLLQFGVVLSVAKWVHIIEDVSVIFILHWNSFLELSRIKEVLFFLVEVGYRNICVLSEGILNLGRL